MGAARVYLGMHWLTDVLSAWLLATSWLALTLPLLSAVKTGVLGRSRRSGG